MEELEPYDKFSNEILDQLEKTKVSVELLTRSFRFVNPLEKDFIPFNEIEKPLDSFVYMIQCMQYEMNQTFLHAIQDLYYNLEKEENKWQSFNKKDDEA